MKILLTGTRHFVALDTARKLHKQGHQVYTADSVDFDYTGFSRAVTQCFVVPSIRFDETGYIDALISLIQTHEIEKLIPLGEEVFYIARHIKNIQEACPNLHHSIDSIKALETLHNKKEFADLAASLSITTPHTHIAHSSKDVTDYQRNATENIVVKPVYSRFGSALVRLTTIDSSALHHLDWSQDYVVQPFIEGQPVSSFSLDKSSSVITYESNVTLTSPGAMGSAHRIETPDQIRTIDQAIRNKLDFKGQLGLDFIRAADGKLYLLEANPRATIGRLLVDRNAIQFRILQWYQMFAGSIAPSSYLHFFKNLALYPDAVAKWSDPLPAIASQILSVGLPTYIRFRKAHPGTNFQAYSTYDMEYNGTSPQFEVEPATNKDNPQLVRLIESLSTKGPFQLIYGRSKKPLRSYESDGSRVEVAVIKHMGTVAYMAVSATNTYYISGQKHAINYISGLRKNMLFPYKIDWRTKFFRYFNSRQSASLYFYSIMSSNHRAINALTQSTTQLSTIQQVGTYKQYIVNARRFNTQTITADLSFSAVKEHDEAKVLRFLQEEGSKYDLFPVIDSLKNNVVGANYNNSFQLARNGEIIAFAAIVDQRQKKQYIIKNYAWYVRLLKTPFNLIARAAKLIELPKQDKPIKSPAISLCIVKDDDPKLYAMFLQSLASVVAKDSQLFTIAVPVDSRHVLTFDNRYNLSITHNLYLAGMQSLPEVRSGKLYVDAAVL
jgi:predicted ATP-grasp superfamily ATP-dependent carboligase